MNNPSKPPGDATTPAPEATLGAENAIRSTQRMAHQGMEAVRDATHQLCVKSRHAQDAATRCIQQEPVKSVLIAAALGAALVGLVALLSRRSSASR